LSVERYPQIQRLPEETTKSGKRTSKVSGYLPNTGVSATQGIEALVGNVAVPEEMNIRPSIGKKLWMNE
jgi:hypothetical protein